MKKLIINISLLLITAISVNAQKMDFPKLTGPNLGQNLLDRIPEPVDQRIIFPTTRHSNNYFRMQEEAKDAIQYVANSLKEFPIVCIGEYHGSKNLHDFFTRLLADETVQENLDVIIVEFVNATHQSLVDDYISGKDISFQEISEAWRNTCISPLTTWDSPLYYEFLKRVREINKTLSQNRKIRILGGDPPINWENVKSMTDIWAVMSQRNSFPAQLAIEQAIEKNKKVLIVYGAAHLTNVPDIVKGKERKGIVNIIRKKNPGKVKVFSTVNTKDLNIEDRISDFKLDNIYELDKHWLGSISAGYYFPAVFYPNGEKAAPYKGHLLRDLFDALIYIGPQSEWKIVSAPKDVFDDEYWGELNRRSMMLYNEPVDSILRK